MIAKFSGILREKRAPSCWGIGRGGSRRVRKASEFRDHQKFCY